jgi:actin
MISETSIAVVVDNGAGSIKGGLAGDYAPRTKFPTVVGKPKNEAIIASGDNKYNYVGDEAVQKRGVLKLSHPISNGNVTEWHDMIKVWHHCFYTELLADISEQPLLITETANTTEENKLEMANILFETFNCPAVYFMPTPILALYSIGKTTGIVLDSGYDVTNVMPVFEGYSIREAIKTELYGGKAIVDELMKIYEERVPSLKGNSSVGTSIKENECSVLSSQGHARARPAAATVYNLPDGQSLPLGKELTEIPEQMFNPIEGGYSKVSLQQLIANSIADCDEWLHHEMADNALVVGGNTHLTGFMDRLNDEAAKVCPTGIKIDVLEDRVYPTWIGGSIFASLNTFHDTCITRDEYLKLGSSVVTRKCLL